jgi:hypothetical protein
MFRISVPSVSLATLLVVAAVPPSAALAEDIEINGVCIDGTCPPPSGTSDAIQLGQSVGPTSGSHSLTFGDGDQYSITWTFEASFNSRSSGGTELVVDPVVTYVGSSPSVGNDIINFNAFQNYYDDSPPVTWDGTYTETVHLALLGNVGPGSTVSAELFYDGQGLGLVGPYGPGNNSAQNTADLTGLDAPTLAAGYEFTYDFQAGTVNGASASAVTGVVPEPSGVQLLSLVLACMVVGRGLVVHRRSGVKSTGSKLV